MFVNRERELRFFEQHYTSDQAELIVLYGRRRVGKTELLRAFCTDKKHIFFVADLGTEESQLAEFTRQIGDYLSGDPGLLAPFASWEAAFNFLISQMDERLIVVIDELTYLIAVNPAVPSILQKLWDTRLKETSLFLALSGSYVGVMEQTVLAYRAPLYGRRTGQWRLQPFTFWDVQKMLPTVDIETLVHVYAILGGVPAYLRQYDPSRSLSENIEQKILTVGAYLYDEPRFLLLQELREPNRYFAILEAVAGGRTRGNEIAQVTGIAPTSISFYLKTLQALGLVERSVPATERSPDKSKLGIYQVADPYFRFWFRFVYPNRSLLERGETALVLHRILAELEQFTGPAFETICREHIWRMASAGRLGFTPQAVGRWWNRQEEIDVMAIGASQVLVGECKWSKYPIGVNILNDLARKSALIPGEAGRSAAQRILFSRAGFTPELTERAVREGVLLVDLPELAQVASR